jgi:hypothetical protein
LATDAPYSAAMFKSIALLTVLAVTPAFAELTEDSPSTLNPREVRIGLTDVGVGLWGHELLERIEVSTHHFMWGAWAFGVPAYDVRAKFEFWRDHRLSLAVAGEIMQVDLLPLVGGDETMNELTFRVVPIEAWAGYTVNDRVRLTAGVVYTSVALRGATQSGPIDELGGTVGTSNLEWRATAQYQASKRWYLIGGARVLGYQSQWAKGTASEGSTTNETTVEGDALGVGHAWTINAAAHLAMKHFNLRLGVEYGNYHVPFVNFVAHQRGFLPMLDLYWRL